MILKNIAAMIASVFLISNASSSSTVTVAILDSGTDMKHKDIIQYAWENPYEIANNNRDEDRNGYQDDIYGWNFAEGNNEVIYYRYLDLLNDDVRKFFELQTRMFLGSVSDDEMSWLRSKVKDNEFIKRMATYGNFMHGTHVAGIAVEGLTNSEMFAVKLIPTEVSLPGKKSIMRAFETSDKALGSKLVKFGLKQLAQQQMNLMEEIAYYVDGHKADIANGSFGTGYTQAKMIVENILKKFLKLKPTEEQVQEYATYFVEQLIINGQRMVDAAPNTLFVFAAGNDGIDNDEFPTSPTNIVSNNVISVAASLGRSKLASFSNYGATMVDVAAPGVAIESAAPGDEHLAVSGTSQAAPYVANIAARIKEENGSLAPKDIKEIILKTVDVKEWLSGKVLTSGLVNKERAIYAARESANMDLSSAINISLTEVKDLSEDKSLILDSLYIEGSVLPLPSMFNF